MTEDLIDLYKNTQKLMPLVHLPVQSGSDKILESMNRKHTIKDYLHIFEKLKKINSKIEFSSDFIIGYPGEKKEDFENTLSLIEKVNFINSYYFIFSSRTGTIFPICSSLPLNTTDVIYSDLPKVWVLSSVKFSTKTLIILFFNSLFLFI